MGEPAHGFFDEEGVRTVEENDGRHLPLLELAEPRRVLH
jgi:hypothetical protein